MTKPGWVSVFLYDPVEFMGETLTEVVFRPVCMDDIAAWDHGEVKTSMGLMSRLTKPTVSQETLLRLTYPADAPRVRDAFLAHLPLELREAVAVSPTVDRAEAKAQAVSSDPADVGGDPRPWINEGQYPPSEGLGPLQTDDPMPTRQGMREGFPDDFTLPE